MRIQVFRGEGESLGPVQGAPVGPNKLHFSAVQPIGWAPNSFVETLMFASCEEDGGCDFSGKAKDASRGAETISGGTEARSGGRVRASLPPGSAFGQGPITQADRERKGE